MNVLPLAGFALTVAWAYTRSMRRTDMERLTTYRADGRAAIANNDGATPLQQTMKIPNIIDRLAAIEDILGDEYDLERLRNLVEADREG
jgi:hypothetical protein